MGEEARNSKISVIHPYCGSLGCQMIRELNHAGGTHFILAIIVAGVVSIITNDAILETSESVRSWAYIGWSFWYSTDFLDIDEWGNTMEQPSTTTNRHYYPLRIEVTLLLLRIEWSIVIQNNNRRQKGNGVRWHSQRPSYAHFDTTHEENSTKRQPKTLQLSDGVSGFTTAWYERVDLDRGQPCVLILSFNTILKSDCLKWRSGTSIPSEPQHGYPELQVRTHVNYHARFLDVLRAKPLKIQRKLKTVEVLDGNSISLRPLPWYIFNS